MKLIFTILLLSFVSCKSQNPIEPRYSNPNYGDTEGAYYKDTFNDYDRFEGTWQYANGSDTLTIVLQKKEMQYIDNSSSPILGPSYYEDILVGEYRYVKNGNEKVNTLPALQNNYNDPDDYNLSGGIIQKYNPNVPGVCIDCNPGEIEVALTFSEPNVSLQGGFMYYYFRHFTENGVEKLELKMHIKGLLTHRLGTTNLNDEYSIPQQEFTLIKQ